MAVSAYETDPPGAGGLSTDRTSRVEPAAPMRVLALDPAGGTLARCAGTDGIPQTVETVLVAPLEPGAIVLVQAGIALVHLDAEWAP